jgi:magnesium transporter
MEITMIQQKKASKLGLAPGTLVFTGIQKMQEVQMQLMQYDEHKITVRQPHSIAEAIAGIEEYAGNSWLNIDGLHDVGVIEQISSHLSMHKLSKEDILSVNQRPKLEEYEDHLHLVLHMISPQNLDFEQVSFVLSKKVLVSFQEQSGDTFGYVRKRLTEDKGQIRKKGVDYLLYALLDSIVDYYFAVLEQFGEKLSEIETELLEYPDKKTLNMIYQSRKEMLEIRRAIYPLREVTSRLEKIGEPIVCEDLSIYYRDLYDHTLRVIEGIEGFRDTVSGLVDLYMNSVSNRMNEIMKVLTIIATIFIPLTFIAGIYGMNFDHMPELHFRYSYFIALGVMFLIFIGMLVYFRRKKWL